MRFLTCTRTVEHPSHDSSGSKAIVNAHAQGWRTILEFELADARVHGVGSDEDWRDSGRRLCGGQLGQRQHDGGYNGCKWANKLLHTVFSDLLSKAALNNTSQMRRLL